MAILLLVKHAQPEIVTSIPSREWKLSDAGKRSCLTLAEQLRVYAPEVVVASREPKASETGKIVAQHLELPWSKFEGLHEHERSNEQYSGQETFHSNIRAFFLQPDKLSYGQETANQAHDRFSAAVDNVMLTYPDKTVVVVCHGTVITLYISRRTGLEPYALWASLGLPSLIAFDTEQSKVIASVHDIP